MKLSNRAEDLLGKLLVAGICSWLLGQHASRLVAMALSADAGDIWLQLLAQAMSLFFLGMIVGLTVRRLPPRTTASGWEPRVTAVAGTFALMLLVLLPMGDAPDAALVLANVLIFAGTAGSIWSLHYLGRSFAVMAAARELVTGGPYAIVRHPLYLAEALTAIGIVLAHWNLLALLVGGVQLLLQFRRMQHEERVLRDSFPEYDAYAARTPMIVPGLARASAAPPAEEAVPAKA